MSMKVKDILKSKGSKVWSIQTKDTIQETVRVLVSEKIGGLLVYDEAQQIVGIITERDIMRAVHEYGKNISAASVAKVMTEKVIIGTPDDDLDYIMNIMTQNRVRHIPVMENGELQGIISIGDVVKAQLHDSQVQIKYLKDYMNGR